MYLKDRKGHKSKVKCFWLLIQQAKKLICERSNFTCESNYGPVNKGKPMGICGNKGGQNDICFVVPSNKYLVPFVDLILTLG
jgi:hypothetical protein